MWRTNYARKRRLRMEMTLSKKPPKKPPEEALGNAPGLDSTSQAGRRNSGPAMHDAAQQAPHAPRGIPQGPLQSRSGDSVIDVDAEASPRQTVPDDASIFVSESEDGSSTAKVTAPGTKNLKEVPDCTGKSSGKGGGASFDEWVAALLRASQRSESDAGSSVREGQEAPAGQTQVAGPVHQPEPERQMESPRPLEEEQNSVQGRQAEVERRAKPQPPVETKLGAEPEKRHDSALGTGGSAKKQQNASVPGPSKRIKSSFDWAEVSADDDPEIGFSEWKEKNLPDWQTQPPPRSEAARKPEKPSEAAREHGALVSQAQPARPEAFVKTKQEPSESQVSTAPSTETRLVQVAAESGPKKMLWSQVVRGSSTQSGTLAQAQRGSESMSTSDQKKSDTPWPRVQAQPSSGSQEEEGFPALTTKDKGKQVDRRVWKKVQPSEQASVSTEKAKGKQAEPVNPFQALEPLVERSASSANSRSPKEEESD
ncbi:hypothetical protein VTH06DRAFT_7186 [Thermothelomyces fergusii]